MSDNQSHPVGLQQENDGFAHGWTARLLPGPPLIAPARQFVLPRRIPGEEEALHRGAVFAQVTAADGSTFLATCARGFTDPTLPSGLWPCPGPDDLLIVAGGYAYLVPTLHPATSTLLEQRPVTAVLPAPDQQLILLAGFHDVLALGPEGVRWRTARLSWEGLTALRITGGQLHGMGWDMFRDAEVPFTVDLHSGSHQGGGFHPARTDP